MVPFVYYSIINKINFRKFSKGFFIGAFSSCLAISLSLGILCFQIDSVKGSYINGINHILYSLEKRTHSSSLVLPKTIASSLEASTTSVVAKYLNGIFFDANNYLHSSNRFVSFFVFKVRYLYLIFVFLIASVFLYFRRKTCDSEKDGQSYIALIYATWFSILAPLSWFIIFKAHSYIHTHMNYIVWQMPFTIFGFAVCGLVLKNTFLNSIRLKYHR